MPNNPINKVVYGNDVLMDLTADTVEPASLVLGTTAHDRSGAAITGTFDPSIYVEKAGDTMTGSLVIQQGDPNAVQSTTTFNNGHLEIHKVNNGSAPTFDTGSLEYAPSEGLYISTHPNGHASGQNYVNVQPNGEIVIHYSSNDYSVRSMLMLSSGTATRDTTNATAGTCAWQKVGRVVSVVVTGVSLTADAANNSDIFTGLPAANEQTNCIAMGNTSGCTRWYVTTTGALRVGAMALRNQTIYLNFSYISAS